MPLYTFDVLVQPEFGVFENAKLQFYTSQGVHAAHTLEWQRNSLTLELNLQLPGPDFLHVDLYITTSDLDGFNVQALAAKATAVMREACRDKGTTVKLEDYENKVHGTIRIRPAWTLPAYTSQTANTVYPSDTQTNTAGVLIQRVKQAYERLEAQRVEFNWARQFYSFETPHYTLPVVAYAAAACRIDKNGNHETLLWHWFTVASWLLGMDVSSFESASLIDKAEVFNEMATLVFRGLLYSSDFVVTPNGVKQASDQWNNVNSSPPSRLTGYDCEDGAAALLQLVYTIQNHVAFRRRELNALQRWLRQYTAFLTLGTIRTKNGYCCHAFCTLMDATWVNNHMQRKPHSGTPLPVVTLESTTYCAAAWGAQNTGEENYVIADGLLSVPLLAAPRASGGNSWRRVVKTKAPLSIMKRIQLYGQVDALISNNCAGMGAAHILCVNTTNSNMGVPPENIFYYKADTFELRVALLIEPSSRATLESLISDFPYVTLPSAPRSPAKLPVLSPHAVQVLVRAYDYASSRQLIDSAVQQHTKQLVADYKLKNVVTKTVLVQLTDSVGVCLLTLQLNQ